MSGRDFRSFLASHKAEIGKDSQLVTRLLSGQKPSYKENNYDQLYALTKIKRSAADNALQKIEKLSKKGSEYKERQLLYEHKRIWEKEMHRLMQLQQKIENELALMRPATPNFELSTTPIEELYEEISDIEDILRMECDDFTKQTVEPVRNLKEDVDQWVRTNRNQLAIGVHDEQNEQDVMDILTSVKTQQRQVLTQLAEEYEKIEEDLFLSLGVIGFNQFSLNLPNIEVGAPEAVTTLKCPDEQLLTSCIENFHKLDDQYLEEVEKLEEKYENVIRKSPYGAWSSFDHFHFKHIINQYQDVSKNRRKLYLHRLQKEMQHKTREQLVKHEEWWLKYKSFQAQTKDLINAWKRDKEDLKLRSFAWCEEATRQYNEKSQRMLDHMSQKFICNFLHEKLLEYQSEKLELMKLEADFRADKEKEEAQKREKKQAEEKAKRMQDKEKIRIYKASQERMSAKRRELDYKRMMELQEKQAEERAYHLERIKYRDDLYSQKIERMHEAKVREEEEEEKKEKRLQSLRDQVAINVEDNPERLYEPTESTKHRVAATYDEELETQTPLFNTYTYSVEQQIITIDITSVIGDYFAPAPSFPSGIPKKKVPSKDVHVKIQVAQDRRLKIENALRRANLHTSDYARDLLKNIPPPTQPRKDNISTVFKS